MPRLQSYFSTRPPRTRRTKYVIPVQPARKKVARLSKPVKRAIGKIVKAKEETKYSASQALLNVALDGAIHTPGTDMIPLVPKLSQGTDEYQRIGKTVMPTKCQVDICLTFPQQNPGVTPADMSQQANVLYVVMYILRSKRRHNWDDFAASDDWKVMFDNGSGGSVPFGVWTGPSGTGLLVTNTASLQLPIEKAEFYQVKKKIVKLVRNQGLMFDGTPGVSPNLPQSVWRGSFTYKLPKLTYDDSVPIGGVSAPAYPTNNCTFLALGYAMGTNYTNYAANPDGSPGSVLPNALSATVRTHWWYKDA